MPEDATDRIEAYVRERVDGGLRAVGSYGPHGVEFGYLRDDLRTTYTENRGELGTLVSALESFDELLRMRVADSPLGERRGTIHLAERAAVVHVPFPDEGGVVVTLDAGADDDLETLLAGCAERVAD